MKENELKLLSDSPEATRRVGAALAEHLQVGDRVGLIGDLGAGKTVLVQGLGAALGVAQEVCSPSYVLVHLYRGRIVLAHVDLYRLSSPQAAELGLEEYFLEAAGIIEWAERLDDLFRDLDIHLGFSPEAEGSRTLRVIAHSPRGLALLEAIARRLPNMAILD
jgi:tRNA threonylcarbamoyladenosine biosynthesis protein TsaE